MIFVIYIIPNIFRMLLYIIVNKNKIILERLKLLSHLNEVTENVTILEQLKPLFHLNERLVSENIIIFD